MTGNPQGFLPVSIFLLGLTSSDDQWLWYSSGKISVSVQREIAISVRREIAISVRRKISISVRREIVTIRVGV